jgi:hypothetical protein
LRMFALAIRRIGEPHRSRRAVSCRTIVAHVRSQPSRFGFAQPWGQHRNWRVIRV